MANNKNKINENFSGEISDKTDASETTERIGRIVWKLKGDNVTKQEMQGFK